MAHLYLGGVSNIVVTFAAILASPVDFLLDTNAIWFVGMFTVLAGLALPVIAICARSRRQQNFGDQPRPSRDGEYHGNIRSSYTEKLIEHAPIGNAISSLGPDQHGINRTSTNAATDEIFHVGAAHRFPADGNR